MRRAPGPAAAGRSGGPAAPKALHRNTLRRPRGESPAGPAARRSARPGHWAPAPAIRPGECPARGGRRCGRAPARRTPERRWRAAPGRECPTAARPGSETGAQGRRHRTRPSPATTGNRLQAPAWERPAARCGAEPAACAPPGDGPQSPRPTGRRRSPAPGRAAASGARSGRYLPGREAGRKEPRPRPALPPKSR